MTRRQSRAAGSPPLVSALFLPAGYNVARSLLWGQYRAECYGWIGGLRNSRAAAVLDAWRHYRAARNAPPAEGYPGPERRKPAPPRVSLARWWASEDELL